MQLCKEAQLKKKNVQAEMGLKLLTCEIVLHTAMPSELSASGSWANTKSVLYPTLGE